MKRFTVKYEEIGGKTWRREMNETEVEEFKNAFKCMSKFKGLIVNECSEDDRTLHMYARKNMYNLEEVLIIEHKYSGFGM